MNVASLLSDSDLIEVQNVKTLLTAENKATKLVSSLKIKVKLDSDNYYKFLEILRKKEDDFKDIISRLEFNAGRPITNPSHHNYLIVALYKATPPITKMKP